MSVESIFDPGAVVEQLSGQLLNQRYPALVYVLEGPDGRPVVDVHALGPEWRGYSLPQLLLALSYQFAPYGPGLGGFGVWLPTYGVVQLVDTGMRSQVIAFEPPSRPHLPEVERVALARELRGMVGTLTGQPGWRADPPLLICDSPADVQPLADEIGEAGLRIDITDPARASAYWSTASFVFVHHQVADHVSRTKLPARADVAILAPRRTRQISVAAARLRTDEVLEFPGCIEYLVLLLGRHHRMVALGRTGSRW